MSPTVAALERSRRGARRTPRVLLVCSSGGHLLQMMALRSAWEDCERTWVTLRAPDSEQLLRSERVVWGHGPTNRSVVNLVRNLVLAWRTLSVVNPDAVLSTGAALAVPFLVLARVRGRNAIYVESFTRTRGLSLSGRLVYPFTSAFFVQWPHAADGRPRARHLGAVL
jgi:beta-1,4-N-acetylglucosaminyltransferase